MSILQKIIRHNRTNCFLIVGLPLIACCYFILNIVKQYFPGEKTVLFEQGEQLAKFGRYGVMACNNCHGAKGEGNYETATPRLAGLDAGYISKQLRDFARNPVKTRVALEQISRDYTKTPKVNVDLTIYTPGTRQHGVMNSIAKTLSPEDIQRLAYYFSQLSYVATPVPYDFETLARGEDLALRGKPEYGIPACISCHGPENEGYGADFPPLAGQPPQYIIDQINMWQTGKRDNDHMALMRNIANQLTDGDKVNVASYLANLSYQVNVD